MNFSKPVKDAGDNSYTIVKLNPHLMNGTDYRNGSASNASKAVTELRLPTSGLVEISDGAFGFMSNCTRISPFIPDSVVTLGYGAFKSVPCAQDLRLVGVCGTIGTGTFTSSKIKSVVFGPGLKKICGWSSGPFVSCTSLTNVTFDAGMTGAMFEGIRSDGFNGCSNLKGTIDLTGFSNLSYVSDSGGAQNPFSGTGLDTVIIGADCTKLGAKFFNGMSSLTTVKFKGAPPEIITTVKTSTGYGCRTAGKLFDDKGAGKTIAVYVTEEFKKDWLPYSATGEIQERYTKFSSDWATSAADVYLLLEGGGGGGGELGNWVYDSSKGEVTNGDWTFAATHILWNLTIGACTKYPDVPSLLDFTDTLTDKQGSPMTIVALNTAFADGSGNATPAAGKVGELRLPLTVGSIGTGAFGRLSACTNVVNFLPDSVVSIGAYAFYKLPVNQDLKLLGVVSLGTSAAKLKGIFNSSGITSVTFGPDFKCMCSWDTGTFAGCASLTNISFDVATTNAMFGGIRYDGFCNSKKLTGTVDLSGFDNLSYVSDYGGYANIFSGTKVEHFIVSGVCTKLGAGFFDGVTTLKDVTFTGAPPTIETNKNESGTWTTKSASRLFNYNQGALKIMTYIKNDYRVAWAPYVLYNGQPVDKVPLGKGVTWKPEYVTDGIDLSLRPVRVVDRDNGLQMIIK